MILKYGNTDVTIKIFFNNFFLFICWFSFTLDTLYFFLILHKVDLILVVSSNFPSHKCRMRKGKVAFYEIFSCQFLPNTYFYTRNGGIQVSIETTDVTTKQFFYTIICLKSIPLRSSHSKHKCKIKFNHNSDFFCRANVGKISFFSDHRIYVYGVCLFTRIYVNVSC